MSTRELHFSAIGSFREKDAREGRATDLTRRLAAEWSVMPDEFLRGIDSTATLETIRGQPSYDIEQSEARAGEIYANCWHMADHENMAMWQLYGGKGDGFAIVTTASSLEASLAGNQESFVAGGMHYIDPKMTMSIFGNVYNLAFLKHVAYSYEQEFRVASLHLLHAPNRPQSHRVAVNIEKLVERVVVAPFATGIQFNLAASILEKSGCAGRLSRSSLETN